MSELVGFLQIWFSIVNLQENGISVKQLNERQNVMWFLCLWMVALLVRGFAKEGGVASFEVTDIA